MILTLSLNANVFFININYIACLDMFKIYNILIMCEEGLKVLLRNPQVVGIINKWGLISSTKMENIMKMEQRHDISIYVINDIPIREDGRRKRYQ